MFTWKSYDAPIVINTVKILENILRNRTIDTKIRNYFNRFD